MKKMLCFIARMESAKAHVDLDIDSVRVRPGDIIFGDISGVVVIPRELVKTIADAADETEGQRQPMGSGFSAGKTPKRLARRNRGAAK